MDSAEPDAVEAEFDSLAPDYDLYFQRRAIDLAENDVVFSLLSCTIDQSRVLDLGCGTGLYLEYCRPSDYLGIDISTGMLDVARERFPRRVFVRGNMAALDGLVEDGCYSGVISTFGSFSYCLQPHQVIQTIYRALQPGGRFFIMAYSPRYHHRSHHITKRLKIMSYTTRSLLSLFSAYPFHNLNIAGLNGGAETLFSGVPASPANNRALAAFLRLETQTVGRVAPDSCYNLIVTGEK